MKKILALVIAALMLLGMVSAFADVSLTVNNPVAGHTYKYFQLFTGDLANGVLSNVKWGANVASSITYKAKANAQATTFTVDTTVTPTVGGEVPQAVLDYLESLTGGNDQDIADVISAWVTGDGTEIQSTTQVPTGYYVIKDYYTDPSSTQTTTLSTNIVAVVNSTTITPKAGTTTHTKEVVDVNDTTATLDLTNLKNLQGWAGSADYDFGDTVPFKLTTTIASDYEKYDSYVLNVHDTMCNGLTLNPDSIVVYVGSQTDPATKATTTPAGDGEYTLTTSDHGFTVAFADLTKTAGAAAGADVVVYYTATLNADGANVVIGNPGNENTSYAEFSNNPNDGQNGTSRTPDSTVVVFTYKTDIDKVNGADGTPLGNAGFTLYKKYESAQTGKGANVSGTTPAGAKSDTFPANQYWYVVKTIAATQAGTSFAFPGIDDGTYILVESETPAGYNTMDPITLTVTATHGASDASAATHGYLVTVLDDGREDFASDPTGGTITFNKKDGTQKKDLVSGEIYGEILNNAGSTLPSTGGIGTTIFYIGGGLLALAAVILLVTKRRMNSEE